MVASLSVSQTSSLAPIGPTGIYLMILQLSLPQPRIASCVGGMPCGEGSAASNCTTLVMTVDSPQGLSATRHHPRQRFL